MPAPFLFAVFGIPYRGRKIDVHCASECICPSGTGIEMAFPRVERYRKELRGLTFCRMSDRELEEVSAIYRSPEYQDMIGGCPSSETLALLKMLLADRVPPDVSEEIIMRYVVEEVVRAALFFPERRFTEAIDAQTLRSCDRGSLLGLPPDSRLFA